MSSYYLGVDIGASKSHALIADEHGCAAGVGLGGPGNHEVVGWDGLRETLHAVVHQALGAAGVTRGQIAGAGFGIAGYDWPGEREPTMRAVESLRLDAPLEAVNDAVIALLAGAEAGWGVAVVAGTSNNCRGRDWNGQEGRVTGCGPAFGEYGGASEVVAKAVEAISLAWTMRGPATELTAEFVGLMGAADAAHLLEGLSLGHYRLSHLLAPLVFDAAAHGDAVAQQIVRWAGTELGSLALGVIRQLGFEEIDFQVILAGSLYCGSPVLAEAMRETIHAVAPRAHLIRLSAPPVVGGVLLGMDQANVQRAAGVRRKLIESTSELLRDARG